MFDGKYCYVNDEVFWCKDGSYFVVEYIFIFVYKNGVLIGVVVIFCDVLK